MLILKVSTGASTCPGCGYSMAELKKLPLWVRLLVPLLLIALAIGAISQIPAAFLKGLSGS